MELFFLTLSISKQLNEPAIMDSELSLPLPSVVGVGVVSGVASGVGVVF